MRITIRPQYSNNSTQGMYTQEHEVSRVEPLTISDSCDLDRWWEREVWFLEADNGGVEGWETLTAIKDQTFDDVLLGDGAYAPQYQHMSARDLTVHGVYIAGPDASTLRMQSAFRGRLNMLYGVRLDIVIIDEVGVRITEGWLSASPSWEQLDHYGARFVLKITCPEPRRFSTVTTMHSQKYWRPIQYTNWGDAPAPFIVRVTQAVTSIRLQVTLANGSNHILEWAGDADSLTLDSGTLIPTGSPKNPEDKIINPFTGLNGVVSGSERVYLMPGKNVITDLSGGAVPYDIDLRGAWW